METRLVSIEDAQRILGLSRGYIYSLIGSGTLETIKIGRRQLVKTSSIAKLAGDSPVEIAA